MLAGEYMVRLNWAEQGYRHKKSRDFLVSSDIFIVSTDFYDKLNSVLYILFQFVAIETCLFVSVRLLKISVKTWPLVSPITSEVTQKM